MPSFDQYKQDDYLRLLLQGVPGSGKTSLCFKFPGVQFINLDRNLGGPLRYARENKIPLPIGYDDVDVDDKGNPVPMKNRWPILDAALRRAQENPLVQTIVIDSGTILADMLIAEVLRSQGKNAVSDYKDGRQFWGFFANAGKGLMASIIAMRKNIIIPIHERFETDNDGKVVYPAKVTWPGQVGDIIGLFFTDVWRVSIEPKLGAGGKTVYEQTIETMPSHKYALKNSLGLPPKFVFDWKLIENKMKGVTA